MVHIVAQCHEEGLEHYLRSYVKVQPFLAMLLINISRNGILILITFLPFHSLVCTQARALFLLQRKNSA